MKKINPFSRQIKSGTLLIFTVVLFLTTGLASLGQEENHFKVITYNIWNGYDFGKDPVRREKVQQWIKSQQPSVVALQELCSYTPGKLQEDATSWGHNYSVLLKTTGYSVGLTSDQPIVVEEKILEGMHHGALHARTRDIDFLVVHLHPGSILRRREEAPILIKKLEKIRTENEKYIVLGDFNSHSPIDADLYDPNGYFLNRLRESNKDKELNGNLRDGNLDFSVISSFLSFPLIDVVQRFTHGMAERGSFPSYVLGPENKETRKQLRASFERIDYILASPKLAKTCKAARVCNGKSNWFLSDHYPVIAEFDLSEKE